MVKGKLKNGFNFKIDEKTLDDWELIEEIAGLEEDATKIVKVAKMVLGNEQLEKLKESYRDDKGKISFSAMKDAIEEIFEKAYEVKNS